MLLSGTDAHLGGLGTLIEFKQNARGAERWSGKAGYEGFLNRDVATLPEILEDNGYFTVMSGKVFTNQVHVCCILTLLVASWYANVARAMGARIPEGVCDASWMLQPLWMGASAGEVSRWRPTYSRRDGPESRYVRETQILVNVSADIELRIEHLTRQKTPRDSTRPTTIPKILLSISKSEPRRRNRSPSSRSYHTLRPIGLYSVRAHSVISTTPDVTSHSSQLTLRRYKGVYNDGPYALRERRLKNLVEMGIIDESVVPHKVETRKVGTEEWDTLTTEERNLSTRAMETYAGMVDSIDVNIGKVVEYLKKTGEYDNTFIVFMSDNGAEGAAYVLPCIPCICYDYGS